MAPMKVCVVGGGPAGALVAHGLAKQGHKVTLFESYPRATTDHHKVVSSKAYCVVLSPRGQRALQKAGMDWSTWTSGTFTTELVRHFSNKKTKAAPKNKSFPTESLVISRMALANTLSDAATSAGVEIRYNHKLVDIDIAAHTACFVRDNDEMNDTHPIKFHYDLLVGCDGVNSRVRSVLEEQLPTTFQCRKEEDTMQYQVAITSKSMDEMLLVTTSKPASEAKPATHSWSDRANNSLCLAFPYENRGTLLALIFPGDVFTEMQENDSYHEKISMLLSDINEIDRLEIVRQMKQGVPSSGGTCIWPNRFGVDNIVLIGDSAHGMWPSLGQGCNCALESAAAFLSLAAKTREGGHDDPSLLVAQYEKERYADAMAAVDLTYRGIGSTRSRHSQNAPILFLAQMALMMLLHKVSFGLVPQPAMMRLWKGEDESYSSIKTHVCVYEKLALFATILVPVALIVSSLLK